MASYQYTKDITYLDDFSSKIATHSDFGSLYSYCTQSAGTITIFFSSDLSSTLQTTLTSFVQQYTTPNPYYFLVENTSFLVCSQLMDVYTANTSTWVTIVPFIYSFRVAQLRNIKMICEAKNVAIGTQYFLRVFDKNRNKLVCSGSNTVSSNMYPVITIGVDPNNVPSYDSVFLFEARSNTPNTTIMIHCFQLLFYSS